LRSKVNHEWTRIDTNFLDADCAEKYSRRGHPASSLKDYAGRAEGTEILDTDLHGINAVF